MGAGVGIHIEYISSFRVTWEKLFFSVTIPEILKCSSGKGEGYMEKLSLDFHLSLLFITSFLKSPVSGGLWPGW